MKIQKQYTTAKELYQLLCIDCRRYMARTGAPMRCKNCEDRIIGLDYSEVAALARFIYRKLQDRNIESG